jgi:inositol oxygenase
MADQKIVETFQSQDPIQNLTRPFVNSGQSNLIEKEDEFRNYDSPARHRVRELYRLNHTHQTVDFVLSKKREYLPKQRDRMGIWEALERLDSMVDDSDPDIDLPQIEHALQTAEAIRRDQHPRWLILAGLIHDLGKVLCLYGEPQWAVVGDTFPVGCRFSGKNIFPEYFADNPDSTHAVYSTKEGIYDNNCGLDNVHFSWGHDEYLYQVSKDFLPEESQYIIRYHSSYVIHREGEYGYLMNDRDREMMKWLRLFSSYDLYSKSPERVDPSKVKPFYEDLIAEYLPSELSW